MSAFPDLDTVLAQMAAHGNIHIDTSDNHIDPQTTVADTLLYVSIPGQKESPAYGGAPSYTHCIHRYRVIGGDDITWVSPDTLGSTTKGPFGEATYDDDLLDALWADILRQLDISTDPHAR